VTHPPSEALKAVALKQRPNPSSILQQQRFEYNPTTPQTLFLRVEALLSKGASPKAIKLESHHELEVRVILK
jgi:hypothetical protein